MKAWFGRLRRRLTGTKKQPAQLPAPAPSPPARRAKTYANVHVHLGGAGLANAGEQPGAHILRAAETAKNTLHVSIDLNTFDARGRENIHQINEDFRFGLGKLTNDSATIITSELAVGHHSAPNAPKQLGEMQKYCKDIFDVAYRKLKPGGTLVLVVGEPAARDFVTKALNQTHFQQTGISVREITPSQITKGSYWLQRYTRQFGTKAYRIAVRK